MKRVINLIPAIAIIAALARGGCSYTDSSTISSGMVTTASVTEVGESNTLNAVNNIVKVKFNEEMIKGNENEWMYLHSKTDFELNGDKASVELYVDEVPSAEGGTLIHTMDGEIWSLLIRQGENIFPLISKQWVQTGHVNYYLWISENDSLVHVLMVIKQGAGLNIYEFNYDGQKQVFVKDEIYHTYGNADVIGDSIR